MSRPPSATRLRIYLCLVQGIEDKPMCAAQTAAHLGIKPSTVSYHVHELLKGGYIRELGQGSNPQFYCRGPNSNILDALCSNSNIRIDGGTVKPPRTSNNTQTDVQVRTVRTHINGRVTFEVLKVGDLHPLFDKPYNEKNGVTFWKSKVPYNGKQVSIEFIESPTSKRMNVWPPARRMVAQQLGEQAEIVMISEAKDIVDYLSKKHGWRFGDAEFKGDVEYASSDSELLAMIPESIRTCEANGVWVDCSEGPREIETNDAEKAKVIVSIPQRIQDLEKGQKATVDRTYVVEMKVDRILNILEKLVKATELNGEVIANVVEQNLLSTVERAADSKANANGNGTSESISENPYEVMYR